MFETKKDYNETEMRTLTELLYSSIAIKEQALSSKIFLWGQLNDTYQCEIHFQPKLNHMFFDMGFIYYYYFHLSCACLSEDAVPTWNSSKRWGKFQSKAQLDHNSHDRYTFTEASPLMSPCCIYKKVHVGSSLLRLVLCSSSNNKYDNNTHMHTQVFSELH